MTAINDASWAGLGEYNASRPQAGVRDVGYNGERPRQEEKGGVPEKKGGAPEKKGGAGHEVLVMRGKHQGKVGRVVGGEVLHWRDDLRDDDVPGETYRVRVTEEEFNARRSELYSLAEDGDDCDGPFPLLPKPTIVMMARHFVVALHMEHEFGTAGLSRIEDIMLLIESLHVTVGLMEKEMSVEMPPLVTPEDAKAYLFKVLQAKTGGAQQCIQALSSALSLLLFKDTDSPAGIDRYTILERIAREVHYLPNLRTFSVALAAYDEALRKSESFSVPPNEFVLKSMRNVGIIVQDYLLSRPSTLGMLSLTPIELLTSRSDASGGIAITDAWMFGDGDRSLMCLFSMNVEQIPKGDGVLDIDVVAFSPDPRTFVSGLPGVAQYVENNIRHVVSVVVNRFIDEALGADHTQDIAEHVYQHRCRIYLNQWHDGSFTKGERTLICVREPGRPSKPPFKPKCCDFKQGVSHKATKKMLLDKLLEPDTRTSRPGCDHSPRKPSRMRGPEKTVEASDFHTLSDAEKRELEERAKVAAEELLAEERCVATNVTDISPKTTSKNKKKKKKGRAFTARAETAKEEAAPPFEVAPDAEEAVPPFEASLDAEEAVPPFKASPDAEETASPFEVAPDAEESAPPVAEEAAAPNDAATEVIDRVRKLQGWRRGKDLEGTIGAVVEDHFVFDMCAYNPNDDAVRDVLGCELPSSADEQDARYESNVSRLMACIDAAPITPQQWRAYARFRESGLVEFLYGRAIGESLPAFLFFTAPAE